MIVEIAVGVAALAASFLAGAKHGKSVEQEAVAELVKLEADEKSLVAAIKARVSKFLVSVETDVKAELKKL